MSDTANLAGLRAVGGARRRLPVAGIARWAVVGVNGVNGGDGVG
ncbi:MAG: hypothetical protein AB7O52_11555 [Planctomycetota bacterium]